MTSVVVVGIGREMRGDDAAGLKIVRQWQSMFPETAGRPDVRVELIETPSTALLEAMRGARVAVLVDAVRGGGPPGSVHVLEAAELSAYGSGSRTAHGWGVGETLALARAVDPGAFPARVTVVGIEVGDVVVGSGLTSFVRGALKRGARIVQGIVEEEAEAVRRS